MGSDQSQTDAIFGVITGNDQKIPVLLGLSRGFHAQKQGFKQKKQTLLKRAAVNQESDAVNRQGTSQNPDFDGKKGDLRGNYRYRCMIN